MSNMRYSFLNLLVILMVAVAIQAPLAYAGSATLTWNANNTEPDFAGYKIYYGTSTRTGADPKVCGMCGYTSKIDNIGKTATPSAPSYILNNLTDGVRYYFSVSAYDTSGNESSFSGEVYKDIPSAQNITNITFSAKIEGLSIAANRNFTIKIINPITDTEVNQSSATTDASGNLVFSSIPIISGTYHIIIYSQFFLPEKMSNVSLTSNNTTPIELSKLLSGDLNNDKAISAGDWDVMSPVWFTNNATADINKDGIVNSIDFGFINKNFGVARAY